MVFFMRTIIEKLVVVLLLLVALFACNRKEVLDSQRDYALIKAMESARSQNDENIDVEALEEHSLAYEKNNEKGKYCLANAFIGYKLYLDYDYDRSIIYLKKAESCLEYCDSMSSFVYGLIVRNLSTTDTLLALKYATKALEKDLEYNNLRRLPYLFLDKSLLMKGDSAKFYLQKSLELFDDWGDKVARCQYAKWHADEMEPDSIIAYMKPCYDSIKFTGHAYVLAGAYLKKDNPDSAKIYIDRIKQDKSIGTKPNFFYRNSQLLTLTGEYEEACKWWEEAFNLLLEESKFMLNQRLGAINAEYDLLNVELQNEKRRVRMMMVYNMILVVLVALLIVALVLMKRYKRDINVMEIDIAKRKERFNVLFEKHRADYKMDKGSVMTDAMRNLEKLHEAYPTLTRTEVAIIWLLFMKCSTDSICEALNITQNYYYQRKSAIYRTFGLRGKDEGEAAIERIVREYLFLDEK